jgi:23S rRNA (cytosine1962-C5)-methyltransferase
MPAAFERRGQPEREDFIRQPEGDDASTHGEDVGVVVLAGESRSVEIVAERGAHAADLVGRDLLALTAAAKHDAAVGFALGDRAADTDADRRIVHRGLTVRAVVVHGVPKTRQRLLEVFLEGETRMVRANRDSHSERLYYVGLVMIPTVVISARGEARLRGGHPWIYRADVGDARAAAGDLVVVKNARGRALGRALYSDRSQIAIRVVEEGERHDDGWLARRIDAAIAFRGSLALDATAYRLVHGEADLLPSLIVDRYGGYLAVQTLSQGMDRLLPEIVRVLTERLQPKGIVARNDPRARTLEGLEQRVDVLAGDVPETVAVSELGVEYDVDLRRGQKTGLFLDQRENRAAAAAYARGRVLDCFSYHGGFALVVGKRAQETIAFDVSEDAVARIKRNASRNGVAIDARVGNVFDELRGLERLGERFDTIVLDPPAFAKNKAAVANARSGYKEINLRALKLLSPGGTLVTCSCSYNVNEAAFAEIVYDAAVDAQAHVTVVEKRMQGRDHPVLLGVPETYYLKCFILRKL